jgi:hypothetical protein
MIRLLLWLATMLFFVAFFTYGYVLWRRSRNRRTADNTPRRQ